MKLYIFDLENGASLCAKSYRTKYNNYEIDVLCKSGSFLYRCGKKEVKSIHEIEDLQNILK